MNDFDKAIVEAFPLVPAPKKEALDARDGSGIRFVVGSNGLAREVMLPFLRVVHMVSAFEPTVKLPYGEVEPVFESWFEGIPRELIREFKQAAVEALPNEVAGAFIWDSCTNDWRFARRETITANGGYVSYREVKLEDMEHLVVDVHSHAAHPAFFSSTDDKDDRGSMRFSLVLGNVDTPNVTSAFRLNLAGYTFPASVDADGNVEVVL